MINIYINELSIHQQFHTKNDFKKSIETILKIYNYLSNNDIFNIFENTDYYNLSAIKGEVFIQSFNKLPADLKFIYKKIVFEKNVFLNWKDDQIHKGIYKIAETNYEGYTIAEFAVRRNKNPMIDYLLINYSNSKFPSSEIDVDVQGDTLKVVFRDDLAAIKEFIDLNEIYKKYTYTEFSNPPTDDQTFLRGENFKYTGKSYKKHKDSIPRKIYECDKGNYWYVDHEHPGAKAHIEVFDSNYKHLGTSLINAILVNEKYKKDRSIKDYI